MKYLTDRQEIAKAMNFGKYPVIRIDVSTPDITIQAIHRTLGISETAISNLRELNTQNRQDCLNFISAMLSSSYFDSV